MLSHEIISMYYGRYQHLWLKVYHSKNKWFKTFYMGDHRDVCVRHFGMDYSDVCSLLRSRFHHVKEYSSYWQVNFFKEVDKYAAHVLIEKLSKRDMMTENDFISFLLNKAPSTYLDLYKIRRNEMRKRYEDSLLNEY